MMYFKPELVHFEKNVEVGETQALPYFRYPLYKGDVPETGALASAKSSSAEKGKFIVESVIPELVEICKKEFH